MSTASCLTAPEPSFRELFTPKLVTVLREGYGAKKLQADALAGLIVAIVALPLSMAIAIASGTTPDRGLYTAIVAGFIISAVDGSRFQIGGPAGAFIVLIAATIERHGYDGLALATIIAGLILMVLGFLRLGVYIKYIPHSVIVAFTAGIAGASPNVRHVLVRIGLKPPLVRYAPSVADARMARHQEEVEA